MSSNVKPAEWGWTPDGLVSDWKPFAEGLRVLVPGWGKRSPLYLDGVPTAPTWNGTASEAVGAFGPQLDHDANGCLNLGNNDATKGPTNEITVVYITQASTLTQTNNYTGLNKGNGYRIATNSSSSVWNFEVSGTNANSVSITDSADRTLPLILVGRWASNTLESMRAYRLWDGALIASDEDGTPVTGPIDYSDATSLYVGANHYGSANCYDGDSLFVAVWDRVLTDSEVEQFVNDPWGLIRPARIVPVQIKTPTIIRQSLEDGVKPAHWNWRPEHLADPYRTIAEGLVSVMPCWLEPSGSADIHGYDLVTGKALDGSGSYPMSLYPSRYGHCLARYDSQSTYIASPLVGAVPGGITFIVGRKDTRTGDYGGVFCVGAVSGSQCVRLGTTLAYVNQLDFSSITGPGYTDGVQIDDSSYGRNDYHVFAGQAGFGKLRLWIDGKNHIDTTLTSTHKGLYPYANQRYTPGQWAWGINGFGEIHFAYVWDRELTEEEIQLVTADPWGMIRPVRLLSIPPVTTDDGARNATATLDLPALTASGTATHVGPVARNATAALDLPALTASGTATHVAPSASIYHFRWRDDDNNEASATWLQTEDSNYSVQQDAEIRLRIQLRAPPSGAAQVECAEDGTEDWFTLE